MTRNTGKKPANQKGKSVYFNLDDPDELRLYQYANKIKNFSGYLKAMLYADMIKNREQAPVPFQYATTIQTNTGIINQSPESSPAIEIEEPKVQNRVSSDVWDIPSTPTVKGLEDSSKEKEELPPIISEETPIELEEKSATPRKKGRGNANKFVL